MNAENITTQAGRARLPDRPAPYWYRLAKGRDIGYRTTSATWIARLLVDGKRKFSPIDGARSFEDARKLAEKWFTETTAGTRSEYTVDAMIADYVEHIRINNSDDSAHRTKLLLHKHVLPRFKRPPSGDDHHDRAQQVAPVAAAESARRRHRRSRSTARQGSHATRES